MEIWNNSSWYSLTISIHLYDSWIHPCLNIRHNCMRNQYKILMSEIYQAKSSFCRFHRSIGMGDTEIGGKNSVSKQWVEYLRAENSKFTFQRVWQHVEQRRFGLILVVNVFHIKRNECLLVSGDQNSNSDNWRHIDCFAILRSQWIIWGAML